jgi:hypothetical protein
MALLMKRLAGVLLLAALLSSGCLGAEASRARDLLQDAERAMADVRTLTYEGDLTFEGAGETGVVRLRGAIRRADGGMYDQVLTVSAEGPGTAPVEGRVVVHDGHAWAETGGRWVDAGSAAGVGGAGGASGGLESFSPDDLAKLAPYIEDVSVQENQIVAGSAAAVVACRIDAAGLLREITDFGGETAVPGFDEVVEHVADGLGDVDAVLVLDQATHMLRAARLTVAFEARGTRMELRVGLRITGVNRPVTIPEPAAA